MKKILYVTDTLSSGGVERQLVTLINGLDRSQFEPHVLCLYGERAGRSLHFLPALENNAIPVTVLNIGLSAKDKVYACYKITSLARQIEADILQPMNYHSNLLSGVSKLFLPQNTKLIGTMRSNYSDHQMRFQRIIVPFCSIIICNSPDFIRHLRERAGISDDKLRFIPNGIEQARFRQNPNPTLRDEIAPHMAKLIVMLTRISREKQPHIFVEALGKLVVQNRLPPDTYLVIIGEQDTHPLHYIQDVLDETIAKYSLQQSVIQIRQTEHPESYYHAADVTALVSLGEGMPNVVLESLAVGCPVIVSEAANRAEIIEDGVTGWVVRTEDVSQLADVIEKALSLAEDDRIQMRKNCLQTAENYSVENMVKRYAMIYQHISL